MDLPPNWTRYTTDDGKEYFHNDITNSTQWEKPAARQSTESVYNPSITELGDFSKADTTGTAATTVNNNNPASMGLAFDDKVTFSNNNVSLSGGGDMQPIGQMRDSGSGSGGLLAMPKFMSCFDLTYWQAFFDVSTDDVKRRVTAALIPKKEADQEIKLDFRTKPDLWGPFWICTTLVIFLSATGNLGQVMSAEANTRVETDWELVTLAATMMYGALFGVPMVAFGLHYFAGQNTSDDANLRSMLCTYGYSFVSLLPASLLMLLPSAFWRWLVCLAGCALSCLFVKTHLWGDFHQIPDQRLRYAMMSLLFGSHIIVYFTYRLYFFSPKVVTAQPV